VKTGGSPCSNGCWSGEGLACCLGDARVAPPAAAAAAVGGTAGEQLVAVAFEPLSCKNQGELSESGTLELTGTSEDSS